MSVLRRCAVRACFCARNNGQLCSRIDCPWPLTPYTEADAPTEEQTIPDSLWNAPLEEGPGPDADSEEGEAKPDPH